MLQNEGRPGIIYSVKGTLTDTQFDRLEKQLKESYSGAANAGKNLILESLEGAAVTPYNWSPKEMDFIESNRELSRKLSYAYGVPPMLIGIPGDNTYSNYKEARLAFWEDTVIFYLEYIKGEFNNWFFEQKSDLFFDFDLDDIPALAPKREMLWERAEKANFLTTNEKREMVGMEKIDGGDVLLVPANMIPLDLAGTIDEEPDQEEEEEVEDEVVKSLIKKGFTEDEALEMIGIPAEE